VRDWPAHLGPPQFRRRLACIACAAVARLAELSPGCQRKKNLTNQRPAWLDQAHRKLDEPVFAAYGWDPDISDEGVLERLLELNLERAGAEAGSGGAKRR